MVDLSKSTSDLTALGINIGGGGFTMGAMKYFKILGQWEEQGIIGAKAFDKNFTGIDHPLDHFEWPVDDYIDQVDYIFANPPCTPWSTTTCLPAEKVTGKRHLDKRLDLTKHTIKTAFRIKPKVLIIESVENAYILGRKSYYEQWLDEWISRGYSVTYFLNDSIIQGTPHIRRRFHFIVSKYKVQLKDDPGKFNITTVRDVIEDIPESVTQNEPVRANPLLSASLGRVKPYEYIRNGHLRMPDYKGPKPSMCARKLAWDFPGPTILAFHYAHPEESRFITYREGLRIGGYPDWYEILNPLDATDAVMPPVSTFLAEIAYKTIKKAQPIAEDFRLVDWRKFGKPHHFTQHRKQFFSTEGLI